MVDPPHHVVNNGENRYHQRVVPTSRCTATRVQSTCIAHIYFVAGYPQFKVEMLLRNREMSTNDANSSGSFRSLDGIRTHMVGFFPQPSGIALNNSKRIM